MHNNKKTNRFLSALMIALTGFLFTLFTACDSESEWQSIYNGEDLDGFDLYLGSSLPDEWAKVSEKATTGSVFSIVEMDGDNVIRISGEINGALATKESFENYHLRLVYKWGDTVYNKRNSGLLYHSFGDLGAAFGTWMANIELQLMHENLGDTYLMLNTTCEIPAVKNAESGEWVYAKGAERQLFGNHLEKPHIRKNKDLEKPLGEWNVVDLYCYGRTAVHVTNGEIVMVNYNTGTYENGKIRPLTSGKIQVQSEGAELFIQSMAIRPIESLPAGLLE